MKLYLVMIPVIVLLLVVCGCGGEEAPQAQIGDTVKVHYTGTLDDGSQFDSSAGREPLQFTLGQGQVIPGFEQAVIGMSVGETKTVRIPPEEAYGPYYEALVLVVDRAQFGTDMEPEVGQQYVLEQGGQTMQVTVIDVSGSNVTLDANHRLAGMALTFEIELVEISG